MEQPTYYAVIPANVRYNKNLKASEKLLYGEITCLTQKTGECFATNKYFADLYQVSKETVSRWINNLKKYGYLNIKIEYGPNDQIINRYIQINQYPIDEKINTPIDEKIKDNNTRINNTRIIKEKIYKKEIDIIPDDKKEYINSMLQLDDPGVKYQMSKDSFYKNQIDSYEKLKRIDKLTDEQIFAIMQFVKQDSFWKNNIMSLKKLRDKNPEGIPYWLVMIQKIKQAKDQGPKSFAEQQPQWKI